MVVEKVETPSWETLFWALVESMEQNGKEVKIDDHFSVKHKEWSRGEMFYTDEHNIKLFDDFCINIVSCCCEDAEEYAGEVTNILLDRFNKWYERQVHAVKTIFDATCWEQAEPFYDKVSDRTELDVLRNCVWGIEGFQYSFDTLMENGWNYGLPIERTKELWRMAYWFVAEGCMQ